MKAAKAVVAGLVAGLTALGTALIDDSISSNEWLGIISAVVITAYATWQIPNKQPVA
jgi:hypothetical protein